MAHSLGKYSYIVLISEIFREKCASSAHRLLSWCSAWNWVQCAEWQEVQELKFKRKNRGDTTTSLTERWPRSVSTNWLFEWLLTPCNNNIMSIIYTQLKLKAADASVRRCRVNYSSSDISITEPFYYRSHSVKLRILSSFLLLVLSKNKTFSQLFFHYQYCWSRSGESLN